MSNKKPMSEEVFKQGLDDLQASFPSLVLTEPQVKVWYKNIKDFLNDGDWLYRVECCIRNCQKAIPTLGDIVDKKGLYYDYDDDPRKYTTI